MQTNEPTQNKYDEALSKYPTRLDDAAIAAEVAALIDRKREEYNTPDVKKFLFHCIDLTTLRSEDNDESVPSASTPTSRRLCATRWKWRMCRLPAWRADFPRHRPSRK